MEDELRLIERTNATLKGLEDAEVKRLGKALDAAYKSLEQELTRRYDGYSSSSLPNLLPNQRALLLLDQLRTTLTLIDPKQSNSIESRFTKLLTAAAGEGATLAESLTRLRAVEGFVASAARLPIEVAALAAKDAAGRLNKHSAKFAEDASVIITQGLIQGWGTQRTARALRGKLATTKGRAEAIVRTETMQAQSQGAQQFYSQNNIKYVQVIATGDERLCAICGTRNGNVYGLEKFMIPMHVNCRCYAMPYRKEWADLGLTKDAEMQQFHEDGIELLKANGDKPNYGPSPFERAAGLTKAPTAIWKPGSKAGQAND